jgi:hypothetical protein
VPPSSSSSSSRQDAAATSGQPPPPSQPAQDAARTTTSSSHNSSSSTSASRLRPLHPGRPPVRPNAAVPGLPPEAAAAQDIAALVRRYGAAFQLKAASAADTMYAVSSSGRGRGSRRGGSGHWSPAPPPAAAGGAEGGGVSNPSPTAHSDAWLYEQLSLGSVHRFSLMLVPTDPDWAPRGPCHITGRVEADRYPQQGCCELQVHPNSTLPAAEAQQLQRQLLQQLQASWGRPGLLLGVVRWAENYAAAGLQPQAVLQQQQPQQRLQVAARKGGQQLPSAAERRQALGAVSSSRHHDSGSSSSCSSYTDGEYDSDRISGSEAAANEPTPGGSSNGDGGAEGTAAADTGVGFHAEDAAAAASSGPGGFALQLEGLQLDNVGVLQVHTAQLQVQCTRCSSSVLVSLSAAGAAVIHDSSSAAAPTGGSSSQGFQWAAPCSTCQQQQVLQLRPKMVHEMNNTLASCKVAGCRPVDLLPSLMAGQCAECSAVTSLRGVQVGRPATRNCPHCHRQLSVLISYVSIVPWGPPGAGAGGGARGAGRAGGDGSRDSRQRGSGQERLVPGQPLPDYGTCKHYRHSHRWAGGLHVVDGQPIPCVCNANRCAMQG